MTNENIGAMIARATGLVLIVMAASSLLYLLPWFRPPDVATSGWTSYSPPSSTPTRDLTTQLRDTYYVITGAASFYAPSAGQALAGVAMILLSRPIGRWLSRGLREGKKDEAS